MPSTPTSKSQVQAYRFVLRRMQSALIRRDPVMLHDPMRTHSRAMIVGAALAAVGLAGFAVFALLSPSPKLPGDDNSIVVSKQSGQLYVLTKTKDGKKKLTPTFNLASARLYIMARKQQNNQNSGGEGQAQASAPQKVAEAQQVDESQFVGVSKGRLTGIPDGPDILPSDESQQAASRWAVCDEYQRDEDLPNSTQENKISTTAIAGVNDLGPSLKKGQGFLVQEKQSGKTYLIYRTPTSANKPQADAVRAEVDLSQPAIAQAFNGGQTTVSRQVSSGLLNAIPAVQGLVAPPIPGEGQPGPGALHDLSVGSPFETKLASGQTKFYIVMNDGYQEVTDSASIANVLQYKYQQKQSVVPTLQPNAITNLDPTRHPVDVGQFPKRPPALLQEQNFPTMCLGWNPNTEDPKQPKEHTVITLGKNKQAPIPKNSAAVRVGNPNANGEKIDGFYMPPGKAAFVHSAQSAAQFDNGPLRLVTDRGVVYSIPDRATAAGLGLKDAAPAPESIVRLLSPGSDLNAKRALRTFDTLRVPQNAGSYPSQSSEPSAPGGFGSDSSTGGG